MEMISKTISSVALSALGGLGSQTTNTPTVNNNITITTGGGGTEEKFIEPSPYESVEVTCASPQFIEMFNRLCIELLTVNDYKLLANVIDQSKRIIFSVSDLQVVIATYVGCTQSDVTINLMPVETSGGCFCKMVTMYQNVENIKIKSRDFKLMYNSAYNTLKDVYHVCMDRVLL